MNEVDSTLGFRCQGTLKNGRPCHKLLALLVTAPYILDCPRCGYRNMDAPTPAAVDA